MNEISIPAFLRRAEIGASIAMAASSGSRVPGQDSSLERAVRGVTRAIAAKTTTLVNLDLGSDKPHRQLVRELVDKMAEDGAAPGTAEPALAIDDALRVASTEYRKALEKEGLPIGTLALLENWIELQAVARAVQMQGDFPRAEIAPSDVDAVPEGFGSQPDATAPLTAIELGQALGVSDQTVRGRERAGELFAILRPGRRRGVEYPAFQAWPGIAGEPLAKTLAALASPDGTRASSTLAYTFFSGRTDLLGGLTPIEVLLGRLTSARSLEPEVRTLLTAPASERLDAVVRAAQTIAAVDAA